MARYDHLPIRKDAVSLAALLEEAVRRFPCIGRKRRALSEIGWPAASQASRQIKVLVS
jgi:hypothetical protein